MSNQKFYLTLKPDLTINGFKHRDIESFSNFDVKLKPEVRLSVVFHLDTDSKPDPTQKRIRHWALLWV